MAAAARVLTSAALFIALYCLSGEVQVSAQQTPPSPEPVTVAPGPAPDCLKNLMNMSDCISYVQAGSDETEPHKACCGELAGLVESSPKCLCYLLGSGGGTQFKIKLDMKKATDLPSVCGVTTPPPSLCSALGIPVGAPAGSEGPQSPGSQPKEDKNGSGALRNADTTMASVSLLLLASAISLLIRPF